MQANYGLSSTWNVQWIYELYTKSQNSPSQLNSKRKYFTWKSHKGLKYLHITVKLDYRMGLCWGFSLMEHVPLWWLLLSDRAVAENKHFLGYEFTLETCENARTWKMITQINKTFTDRKAILIKFAISVHLKNTITKPFPQFNFQNVTSLTSLMGLKIQFIKYKSLRTTDTNSVINKHQN